MQESNRIELKRELTDMLEKEVVAFLNYRDGGVIYIGVDDKTQATIGGLPAGFDEEEFFMGYSVPQNKELMRVFRDLDMVEQLGSGVPRILEHYPRSIYHFTPNFIRLVLPYVEGFDQVAGQASDQASDQAGKLLKFCATPRSVSEMMQHLGLSHRTYFRNTLLRPLMASGKLAPTIPDKPSSPNQRYVSQEMPKANAKE
jgi:predicted HTH transcriptional regulator